MTIELTDQEIERIAIAVAERLKPTSCNGKHQEDVILDVYGLTAYLNVSKQWVYERTHLKEIPHMKIDGQLRFRKKDIDKWLTTFSIPAIRTGR